MTTKSQESTTTRAITSTEATTVVYEIATESERMFEPEYELGAELEQSTDEPKVDSSPKTGELSFRGRLDMD